MGWHRGHGHGRGTLDEVFPRRGSAASTADSAGENDAAHSKNKTNDAKGERNGYKLTDRMIRDVPFVAETLKPGQDRDVDERTDQCDGGENDHGLRDALATVVSTTALARDVRCADENHDGPDATPSGGEDRENDVYGFEDDVHDGPNLKLFPCRVVPGHGRYSAIGRHVDDCHLLHRGWCLRCHDGC